MAVDFAPVRHLLEVVALDRCIRMLPSPAAPAETAAEGCVWVFAAVQQLAPRVRDLPGEPVGDRGLRGRGRGQHPQDALPRAHATTVLAVVQILNMLSHTSSPHTSLLLSQP